MPIYVNLSVVHWREHPTSTGYEPGHFAENKHLTEDKHFAEDKDLAEHEGLRVKPSFFSRPRKASTYDSAESIATPPPESDLDDEQIRALQEREANADRSQVYHSVRETLMSSSSQDPRLRGDPLRCFQAKTG